jgi:hypothetical protein
MQKRNTVQGAEGGRRSRTATEAVAFVSPRAMKSVRNGSVPMGAPSSFAPSVSMGGDGSEDAGAGAISVITVPNGPSPGGLIGNIS